MRLGICSCCTTGSSGFYDVYGPRAIGVGVSPIDMFFVRRASLRAPSSIRPVDSSKTPFCWFIDLMNSGGPNDPETNLAAIAPNECSLEPVWSLNEANYSNPDLYSNISGRQIHLFNPYDNIQSGTGYGPNSGWALGPTASIVGNRLITTTGGVTTGAFISRGINIWPPPVLDKEWTMYLKTDRDYDKAFLITVSGFLLDDYCTTSFFNKTGSPTSHNPGGTAFNVPGAVRIDICTHYLHRIANIISQSDNPSETGYIEIRLVDYKGTGQDLSFSGASGDGVDISIIAIHADETSLSVNSGCTLDVTLLDCGSRSVLTRFYPSSFRYLGHNITGTDMGIYSNITGDSISECSFLEGFCNGISLTPDHLFSYSNQNFGILSTLIDDLSDHNYIQLDTTDGDYADFNIAPKSPTTIVNPYDLITGFNSRTKVYKYSNSVNYGTAVSQTGNKIAFYSLGGEDLFYNIDDKVYGANPSQNSCMGSDEYDIILEVNSLKSGANPSLPPGLQGHWPLQDNASNSTITSLVGPTGGLYLGTATKNTNDNTVDGPGGYYPRAISLTGASSIKFFSGTIGQFCTGITQMIWLKITGSQNGTLDFVLRQQDYVDPTDDFYCAAGRVTKVTTSSSGMTIIGDSNNNFTTINPVGTPVRPIPQDEWHHLVFINDFGSEKQYIYRNATLASGFTANFDSPTTSGNPTSGNIQQPSFGIVPNSHIADYRIYSGVLSQEEIQAVYNLAFTDPETGVSISTTGERTVYYGERYNWGQVELTSYVTGYLSGTPYFSSGLLPTSVANRPHLPRIDLMLPKQYPNCFSVLNPLPELYAKDTSLLTTTDGVDTIYYTVSAQLEYISETAKILYGPFTGVDYTVYLNSNDTDTDLSGTSAHPNPYYDTGTGDFRVFRLNRHILHGYTGSPVFWEDTQSESRIATSFLNRSGYAGQIVGADVVQSDILSEAQKLANSGLASNNVPIVGVTVMCGDAKQNVPAAIFTNTRTNTQILGTGFPYYWNPLGGRGYYDGVALGGGQPWLHQTGYQLINTESYVKVKIGNNIVLDKQVHNYKNVYPTENQFVEFTEEFPISYEVARSLTAIRNSEAAQPNTGVSGIGFGWFERLWHSEPSLTGSGAANSRAGIPSGWRFHVTDMSGNSLWHLDSAHSKYLGVTGTGTGSFTGYIYADATGTGNLGNLGFPIILGSSDRFIYINNFFLCDDKLREASPDTVYDHVFGNPTTIMVSGAGFSWAITHDGTNKFPIMLDNPGTSNDEKEQLETHTDSFMSTERCVLDFVHHTNLIPYTPRVNEYGTSTCSLGGPRWSGA